MDWTASHVFREKTPYELADHAHTGPFGSTHISFATGPFGLAPSASQAVTEVGDVGTFIAELAAGVNALGIEAARGGPPPEVLDQIAAAGRIGEQLHAGGFQVRYLADAGDGPMTIELHDLDGNSVATLSPAAALELAAGSPLN